MDQARGVKREEAMIAPSACRSQHTIKRCVLCCAAQIIKKNPPPPPHKMHDTYTPLLNKAAYTFL